MMLLAFGLAVDACAHIVHSFLDADGDGRQRAQEALALMGTSVLSGTLTSVLGILPLLFSQRPLFHVFFQFFFSIFLLSIFHGLVVIPVVLSFIGKQGVL